MNPTELEKEEQCKPCPFCGKQPKVYLFPTDPHHPSMDLIQCKNNDCPMHRYSSMYRDEWNKRKP